MSVVRPGHVVVVAMALAVGRGGTAKAPAAHGVLRFLKCIFSTKASSLELARVSVYQNNLPGYGQLWDHLVRSMSEI